MSSAWLCAHILLCACVRSWREYWRWTLVFILDVHNLVKDAGGPNTASDTAFHTFCVMLLPVASFVAYELITRIVYKDRIAGSTLEDSHRISYCTFQQWSLIYAELLYIPVLLVWLRTWTCGSNHELVLIYRNWTCWEAPHIILLIVITALSGFFTFMLPYFIYTRTRRIVVFHDPQLHERYLQSRELEYLIGCNNLYEYTQFYMIASYKRVWSWTRLIQLGQKLLLCVFLIALNTYNAGDALLTQAVLFVIIISTPAFANVFYRSFRCSSSNYLKVIFDWSDAHSQAASLHRAEMRRSAHLLFFVSHSPCCVLLCLVLPASQRLVFHVHHGHHHRRCARLFEQFLGPRNLLVHDASSQLRGTGCSVGIVQLPLWKGGEGAKGYRAEIEGEIQTQRRGTTKLRTQLGWRRCCAQRRRCRTGIRHPRSSLPDVRWLLAHRALRFGGSLRHASRDDLHPQLGEATAGRRADNAGGILPESEFAGGCQCYENAAAGSEGKRERLYTDE